MTDSLDRLEKKIQHDELGSGDMEELSMQMDVSAPDPLIQPPK